MSTLVVHPSALALVPIKPTTSTAASTPLALPSRFPSGGLPRAAAGPTGHTYLYAANTSGTAGGSVVWEYDSKGRRVGEMTGSSSGVQRVATAGTLVVLACKKEAKVMKRAGNGGKWACLRTLELPRGQLTAMTGDADLMAFCADEVIVYELETGRKASIEDIDMPVSCARIVHLDSRPYLLVPSTDRLTAYPIDTEGIPKAYNLGLERAGRDIVVSGTQVAVASEGTHGEVAVVSLTDGDVSTIKFGVEVAGLSWIDGQTLAARTVSGKLLVRDMRTGSISPVELDQPVLDVHALPTPRATRAPSDRPLARVLAENNLTNNLAASAPPKKTSDKNAKESEKRIVSAPTTRVPTAPVRTDIHITPLNPAASRPSAAPASRVISTASTVRIRPAVIDEADETTAFSPGASASVRRAPPPHEHNGQSSGGDAPTWEAFEEMRREIANLQLDMLRMGRGLKNEIRSAVSPLVDELRSSRETIAKQAAEIERLRRGY